MSQRHQNIERATANWNRLSLSAGYGGTVRMLTDTGIYTDSDARRATNCGFRLICNDRLSAFTPTYSA
jgi:hypothetical protein